MKERISEIISEYDRQGIHRTGTDVDLASAAWLKARVEALGVPVQEDRFGFERVSLGSNCLELGELSVAGVPMYDGTFTGPDGVSGRLGPIGSDAGIGVAQVNSRGGGDAFRAFVDARGGSPAHGAILLVTDTGFPPDGVAILNAEHFTSPLGPPVLQVPNNEWVAIQTAVANGASARVLVDNSYVAAEAVNIHGRVSGTDPSLAPIVVMTPRSGWWSCASERGGGIAVWLEVLRDLAEKPPARDVIFTANTGHELGHTGLDHFLSDRTGLIRDAEVWLHLGANFAASKGGAPRLQYSDEAAKQAFTTAMAMAGVAPAYEAPVGQRPGGESRNIFDGGGRFVSIVGGNDLFHHPDDTFPDAVDVEAAAGWARAFIHAARVFACA